jgi:TOD1/MUCI70, glycosyltransferase-like domain
MFGYSERFNDFVYDRGSDIDFICFTDDPSLRSRFWQIEHVSRGLLDPVRAAKQRKILAHRFFPQYDASLYVDNIIRLKQRPRDIFDQFLTESASPLVCFRHPERDCIYAEGRAVISAEQDDPQRVTTQMRAYQRLGYPHNNGLTAAGFLLRRHHDPAVIEMMEAWFEQVLLHSFRDQLSMMVAARQHRFDLGILDLDLNDNDIFEWPCPKEVVRIPRWFDDERYLELNPDVETAKVDPRRHYLLAGIAEGRQLR